MASTARSGAILAAICLFMAAVSGCGQGKREDGKAPSGGQGMFSGNAGTMNSVEYRPLEGNPDALVMPGAIKYPAHGKYLSAPAEFAAPPDGGPKGRKTAVVGSDVARLFPEVALKDDDDVAKLGEGTPIPVGTLVVVGEPIKSSNQEYGGLFKFEDNMNWFYPVTVGGKRGLVFGSDLYGLDQAAERNAVAALRYRENGRYDSFLPVFGLDGIADELKGRLGRDRIAFDEVAPGSYYLNSETPDDMISLYMQDATDRQRCTFVTTDLVAHSLHLVFDRLLQKIEEESFAPKLAALTDAYLEKLDALAKADDGTVKGYSRTIALAKLYFEVPQAILEAAPERVMDESSREIKYVDRDKSALHAKHSGPAREILGYMDKHEGFETLPEILYKEDFSQYKPRGHYTKNGVLAAYFQAMMWFGRIHMYMALANPPAYVWSDGKAKESATELSLELTPVAVLLNDLTKKDDSLLNLWRELFDPITYLIGVSDDLSFDDVMPFLERQSIRDFRAWTANEQGILDMLKKAANELKSPLIAGNSVLHVPSGEGDTPPMGWRLFGQRFTYDSSVHQAVSSPRLFGRMFVQGLDIMKAFGSKTAEGLLSGEPEGNEGYKDFPVLKEILGKFESEFSGYQPEFWGRTYYNRALFLVKSQAQFEQGAGFYFTETPLWGYKAMNASHGTWAELRHDTILYVKQVYGERAGGGDWEPTWRTKPVPVPTHYIEPNLPFFTGSRLLIRDLYEKTAKMGLMPEQYAEAMEKLDFLLAEATEIVRLEVEDKPVNEEQNEYILSIPKKLAALVNPEVSSMASMDPDKLKMALVADVYTNAEAGQVLEVGVGIPRRMWVLLNDGQGGKRIASGYTFSYYEFRQPMDDRLDDDQWKEKVYAPNATMREYEPLWAKGVAKRAEASH